MDIIKEKELEYKEYIDEHIRNVEKAWNELRSNSKCHKIIIKFILSSSFSNAFEFIDELIRNHDKSKYSEEEFDAYRKNFYPINDKEKCENSLAFEKAWEHHYHKNLHHWDWWYKSGNKENMPLTFCVEMVCDWIAMSMKFSGTAKDWYEKNKQSIHLGKNQRVFVEKLLEAFYE